MPHRPGVKSAFENLRPSIVREPARLALDAQQERRLLDLPGEPAPEPEPRPKAKATAAAATTPPPAKAAPQPEPAVTFDGPTLLSRKKREVLIPVTFRIPQTLKERLNEVAKRHDLNQTDLINEGIELNLQRYR